MIKILKLLTGEEIIGDVEVGELTVISKPCLLQLVPSRSNPEQPMMALVPYAPYSKNHKIKVSREFVVWVEDPVEELYNQYNSIFGTGIVVSNNFKL